MANEHAEANKHAQAFVNRYKEQMSTPLRVMSEGQVIEVTNPADKVNMEANTLLEWLHQSGAHNEQNRGGIFGLLNIITRDMVADILLSQTSSRDVQALLAPFSYRNPYARTARSESRSESGIILNRGGTVLLARPRSDGLLQQLVLLDPLLIGAANPNFKDVDSGYNGLYNIPTLSLKLGQSYVFMNGKRVHFSEYLRDHVRPSIIQGNYLPYSPFPQLVESCRKSFMRYLKVKISGEANDLAALTEKTNDRVIPTGLVRSLRDTAQLFTP
jgi:hypothetical protein